jgi:dTDP-4-amino-4,6-dideoxygalactose transaminase
MLVLILFPHVRMSASCKELLQSESESHAWNVFIIKAELEFGSERENLLTGSRNQGFNEMRVNVRPFWLMPIESVSRSTKRQHRRLTLKNRGG